MRSRLLSILTATVLLSGLASAQTTHQVIQSGLDFIPSSITIAPGDTIEWVWGGGIHTATSGSSCTPDGLFDLPLDGTAPTVSYTFNTAGTYDYYCIPHCVLGMTGVINVVAPVPALPTGGLLALIGAAGGVGAWLLRRRR
jgi:plastocyanin